MDNKLVNLEIDKIIVDAITNIRLETEDVHNLMHTLSQNGIIQPVVVAPSNDGKYILIVGHRRLEAAKKLDWNTIPAIIMPKKISEQEATIINALENIQRKEISEIELGRVCVNLREQGLSEMEIATKLSMPVGTITNAISLFINAPETWLAKVNIRGKLRKQAGLSVTVASRISNDKKLTDGEKSELYKLSTQEDVTARELTIILALIRNYGFLPRDAVDERSKYRPLYFTFMAHKENLENIRQKNVLLRKEVRLFLNKKHPGLLVEFKKR